MPHDGWLDRITYVFDNYKEKHSVDLSLYALILILSLLHQPLLTGVKDK